MINQFTNKEENGILPYQYKKNYNIKTGLLTIVFGRLLLKLMPTMLDNSTIILMVWAQTEENEL